MCLAPRGIGGVHRVVELAALLRRLDEGGRLRLGVGLGLRIRGMVSGRGRVRGRVRVRGRGRGTGLGSAASACVKNCLKGKKCAAFIVSGRSDHRSSSS